jgi:HupE / UreJ protein
LQAPYAWQTLRQYIVEGVWHIWIGFDHILFLMSLLLPAVLVWRQGMWRPATRFGEAFWDVFKIVTSFTVAHTITLSLATLGAIELPSRWVESAIAASVMLAALNNVFPLVHGRRWTVAFGFGLIHGFGFASVLADLGLPQQTLLLALVGFNVGVECGQLAIVALFLPLAYAARRTWLYQKLILVLGSLLIVLIALAWFSERAFDLEVLPF